MGNQASLEQSLKNFNMEDDEEEVNTETENVQGIQSSNSKANKRKFTLDAQEPSTSKAKRSDTKAEGLKRIHYKMLAELLEIIHPGWSGYRSMLLRCKTYLSDKEIEKAKTDVGNLFDILENKGIINVGKYKVLEELIYNNVPAINKVKECGKEIQSLSISEGFSRTTFKRESNIKKSPLEKQTLELIDDHSKKVFVVTCVVQKGLDALGNYGILIYSGLPGDGKTETALEVMARLKQSHPDWLFLSIDVRQWSEIVDPDVSSVILLDDALGGSNADEDLINDGKKYWPFLNACIKKGNVKVIMTMRKGILAKMYAKLKTSDIFSQKHIVDLSSEENKLHKEAKRMILMEQLDKHGISVCNDQNDENYKSADINSQLRISINTINKIIDIDVLQGFPQTSIMFCSDRRYMRQGQKFFRNPSGYLIDEINRMIERGSDLCDKIHYCIMCYMLLNGGIIDLGNLNFDIFKKIFSSVNLETKPRNRDITESVEQLNDVYIIKKGFHGISQFKHQTILESVAMSFYKDNPSLLIALCSENLLCEFIRPTNYVVSEGETILPLYRSNYIYFIQRIISSLHQGEGVDSYRWWINHRVLDDTEFVDCMLETVKSNEFYDKLVENCVAGLHGIYWLARFFGKSYLKKQLDTDYNIAGYEDYLSSVKETISDPTSDKSRPPENAACNDNVEKLQNTSGRTLVSLLKHKTVSLSHVIKALDHIVKQSNTEIVETILNKWPHIEKEHISRFFHFSCLLGDHKTIDVLLKRRADITTQQNMAEAFRWSCVGVHFETMEYLLKWVDKNIDSKLLLEYINDEGLSNLHLASFFGRLEAVKFLFKQGLTGDLKTKSGLSILYMAILSYTFQGMYGDQASKIINKYSDGLSYYCREGGLKVKIAEVSEFETNYPVEISSPETPGDYSNVRETQNFLQMFSYLFQQKSIQLSDLKVNIDAHGNTLAHLCVIYDDSLLLELLSRHYISFLSLENNHKLTPLFISALMGRGNCFELLYSFNETFNVNADSLISAISYALPYAGRSYKTLLHFLHASRWEFEDMAINYWTGEVLFESLKPRADKSFTFGDTDNYIKIFCKLMEDCTNIEPSVMVVDEYGNTLAHYFVVYDSRAAINIMCKRNLSIIYEENKDSYRPIELSVLLSRSDIFKSLVDMYVHQDESLNDLHVLLKEAKAHLSKKRRSYNNLHKFIKQSRILSKKDFTFGTTEDFEKISEWIEENVHNFDM